MVAKPHLQDAGFGRAGMPLARAKRLNNRFGATGPNRPTVLIAAAAAAVFAIGVAAAVLNGPADTAPEPDQVASTGEVRFTQPVTVTNTARSGATAPCINSIERSLAEVYNVRGTQITWPVKQEGLRSLLQAGLNCDAARVEMSGSFEIARSELGSVSVNWNPVNNVLRLSVVDRGTSADHPSILDAAGRPVAFVVN